jgi:hypothetical protein
MTLPISPTGPINVILPEEITALDIKSTIKKCPIPESGEFSPEINPPGLTPFIPDCGPIVIPSPSVTGPGPIYTEITSGGESNPWFYSNSTDFTGNGGDYPEGKGTDAIGEGWNSRSFYQKSIAIGKKSFTATWDGISVGENASSLPTWMRDPFTMGNIYANTETSAIFGNSYNYNIKPTASFQDIASSIAFGHNAMAFSYVNNYANSSRGETGGSIAFGNYSKTAEYGNAFGNYSNAGKDCISIGEAAGIETIASRLPGNNVVPDVNIRSIAIGNYAMQFYNKDNAGGGVNTAIAWPGSTGSKLPITGYTPPGPPYVDNRTTSFSNYHSTSNIAIGFESLKCFPGGSDNISIGYNNWMSKPQLFYSGKQVSSAYIFNTNGNVLLGNNIMQVGRMASYNTGVGHYSLDNNVDGDYNTCIGAYTLPWPGLRYDIGIPVSAMVPGTYYVIVSAGTTDFTLLAAPNNNPGTSFYYISGTVLGSGIVKTLNQPTRTPINNVTCIGYQADVSGDNQIQLGNSLTTTFVYGSVQNRSDKRDKIDIKECSLGLTFINKLNPVDFKWNYREDYLQYNYEDEDNRCIILENDGSKARKRYHHGLIAQEVKEVMDEMNIDFGGFQDHKINGGGDILSIGYQELIAPLIKSVQELSQQVDSLKQEIETLKNSK